MAFATLTCAVPPSAVHFNLDPEQVVMARSASYTNRGSGSSNSGSPGGASGSIFKKSAAPMITLNKVIFYGPDTKPRCDTLMDWMSPGGGLMGAVAGAALSALTGGAINLTTKPPTVIFQWGPMFLCETNVNMVNVVYNRFTKQGVPIRAELTIRLQQQPSLLGSLPTNPTSRGLPGRAAHTVSDGDSLARIATAKYGSPGRWRQLADRNGIDDPLRVRPGDKVYLPNPEEFG
jgi:nucleoid-associated protein YgaU